MVLFDSVWYKSTARSSNGTGLQRVNSLKRSELVGFGRESAGILLWCLGLGSNRGYVLLSCNTQFEVRDRRFERSIDFDRVSSDYDDDLLLSSITIGIMVVGSGSRLLFSEGLCRLRLSVWVVILLVLERRCSLKLKATQSSKFYKPAPLFAPQ